MRVCEITLKKLFPGSVDTLFVLISALLIALLFGLFVYINRENNSSLENAWIFVRQTVPGQNMHYVPRIVRDSGMRILGCTTGRRTLQIITTF